MKKIFLTFVFLTSLTFIDQGSRSFSVQYIGNFQSLGLHYFSRSPSELGVSSIIATIESLCCQREAQYDQGQITYTQLMADLQAEFNQAKQIMIESAEMRNMSITHYWL